MGIKADLDKYLFKRTLSENEGLALSLVSVYENYRKGDMILTQGAVNHKLYVLIEGEVTVDSSGEKIAEINNPGDLLGEVSLLTQRVCTASNIAQSDVKLLVIDVNRVSALAEELQSVFRIALHELFAVILAEKLTITNEKARMFEITNRELQEAKRALEVASSLKIDDLSSNQRLIFERLNGIRKNLEEIQKNTPTPQVQSILGDLKPLTTYFASDGEVQNKKVLLVEDDINEQIHAKMSLGGTGVDFRIVETFEEATKALQDTKFDIVCINKKFIEVIELCKTLQIDTKFVFLTSDSVTDYFPILKSHPELSTILAKHPQDRTFTIKNIATTIRKLSSGDLFGMEKYLSWGTMIVEHVVKGSSQRESLIEQLDLYLDSVGVRGPLKRKSLKVAEELLMNAIYDAPTGPDGKPLYNHLQRTVPLELKPTEYASFRFACDGNFLAIAVVDRFGALNRQTILDYLERCLMQGTEEQTPLDGKGGGGNGLFQIIQSSSLTAFNVDPGERTEVIALLNLNIQIDKMSTHPSFHYFEMNGTVLS